MPHCPSTAIAFRNVEATLGFARRLLQTLQQSPNGDLSIADRQRQELIRFVEAYSDNMQEVMENVRHENSSYKLQLMLGRQQELEEALRFVDQAFVSPRFLSKEQQFLEAADWVCVEGYCRYLSESDGPIGPLVAIDSRRSPAVWEAGTSLPLPSLFQRQPQQFTRSDSVDVRTRQLAFFPVICLPSTMARLPELYPLLSHEVGHAVDFTLGLTQAITSDLPMKSKEYWAAWMHEVVADTIGLLLSGEGFALALFNFVRFLNISESISVNSRYPGISLRLAMVATGLQQLTREPAIPNLQIQPLNEQSKNLLDQFQSEIWPIVYRHCSRPLQNVNWESEQSQCRALANKVLCHSNGRVDVQWPSSLSFRLAPSVLALAQQYATPAQLDNLDTLAIFRQLHGEISDEARPDWVQSSSNWRFPLEVLSALRPTFVAADGCTKLPPTELLMQHECVSFVGATHDHLAKKLREVHQKGKRWNRLEFFFASPSLLQQVKRSPTVNLLAERRASETELLQLLSEGVAEHWSMYEFSGPGLFGAFWDSDRPGGRIHISAQLLGTDIKKCPAMDYIWCDEVPPLHYDAYRNHLSHLRRSAQMIAWGNKNATISVSQGEAS